MRSAWTRVERFQTNVTKGKSKTPSGIGEVFNVNVITTWTPPKTSKEDPSTVPTDIKVVLCII